MNRGAPLKRTAGPKRKTPLPARVSLDPGSKPPRQRKPLKRKPPVFTTTAAEMQAGVRRKTAPKTPRRPTGFPPAVRRAIRARAQDRCEACGTYLGPDGGQLQHRCARKMGGRRDPLYNSPANGSLLCGTPFTGCHGLCEARDQDMHEAGFWLKEWHGPLDTPILLHGEQGEARVWLTLDGGYSDSPAVRGEAA